ncbi:hypothetical protein DL762_005407 [Monosporascus cannonballus]|uniref:Uncharacterized protein n=1 Tax=Monosporascus cannonballus TaxID=155416 RepID=A0ABY0H4W6_9PEZI|nr:hypothetical protein DL762_005407 [Monosporascus cannonballus]
MIKKDPRRGAHFDASENVYQLTTTKYIPRDQSRRLQPANSSQVSERVRHSREGRETWFCDWLQRAPTQQAGIDEAHLRYDGGDSETRRTISLFRGATVVVEPDMPHGPGAAADYAVLLNYGTRRGEDLGSDLPADRRGAAVADGARRGLAVRGLHGGAGAGRAARGGESGRTAARTSTSSCPSVSTAMWSRRARTTRSTMAFVEVFVQGHKTPHGFWAGAGPPLPSNGFCCVVALKVLDNLTRGLTLTDSLTLSMKTLGL